MKHQQCSIPKCVFSTTGIEQEQNKILFSLLCGQMIGIDKSLQAEHLSAVSPGPGLP